MIRCWPVFHKAPAHAAGPHRAAAVGRVAHRHRHHRTHHTAAITSVVCVVGTEAGAAALEAGLGFPGFGGSDTASAPAVAPFPIATPESVAVPEPNSLVLLTGALAAFGLVRARRSK